MWNIQNIDKIGQVSCPVLVMHVSHWNLLHWLIVLQASIVTIVGRNGLCIFLLLVFFLKSHASLWAPKCAGVSHWFINIWWDALLFECVLLSGLACCVLSYQPTQASLYVLSPIGHDKASWVFPWDTTFLDFWKYGSGPQVSHNLDWIKCLDIFIPLLNNVIEKVMLLSTRMGSSCWRF